jgi:glycosyltransferase involved in cell wall biosynthesis
MKILYLCPDLGVPVLGRKGASVHVRELIAAFARAGHNVVLAAQVLNKSSWEPPASVAANIVHLRPGSHVSAAANALKDFNATLSAENSIPGELRRILYNQELVEELKRRFESDLPDFIYERASLYGTAGARVARALNVPLFLELNAPLAGEQASYRGGGLGELAVAAERWTLSQADAVLVVSSSLRKHVIALGAEPSRAYVFPNGVNPLEFQPGPPDQAVRARLGLDDGPVLGFVGGLRPWHGVEILPELLGWLVKRNRNLQLLIAGDGQLRSDLEAAFARKKLGAHVVFTGTLPHEAIPAVVRQFDVALAPYPTLDHAFYFSPLKLFEYMACGAAVVAADTGQISEVVRHGKTGLLYPPGDLDALIVACQQLLDSRELRQSLGRAAAKCVHKHYTWERNAVRAVELARSAIAAKRKERRTGKTP